MVKRFKRKQRNAGGTGSPGSAGTTKFTASTSGLEDEFFTWSTAKDAAKFEDTVSKLARHVGMSLWSLRSLRFRHGSNGQTPVARSRPTTEQDRGPGARTWTILSCWRIGNTTSRLRSTRRSKRSTTSKCWPERRTRPSATIWFYCTARGRCSTSSRILRSGTRRRETRMWLLSSR